MSKSWSTLAFGLAIITLSVLALATAQPYDTDSELGRLTIKIKSMKIPFSSSHVKRKLLLINFHDKMKLKLDEFNDKRKRILQGRS